MFTLNERDVKLLASLVDLRVTTSAQLGMLRGANAEAVAKRLKTLQGQGWVDVRPRPSTSARGRPELLFSLTQEGLRLLVEKSIIPADGLDHQSRPAGMPSSIDHCLLLNWLMIHALLLNRKAPCLSADCLSSEAVIENRRRGKPVPLQDSVHFPGRGTPRTFVPDLVFSLRHTELAKSLLFFVEVDCGTEELRSGLASNNSIVGKVRCYQAYFEQNGYRRYGDAWDAAFDGFRLLVVANTYCRLVKLARFVSSPEMAPANFVWLTDASSLLSKGIHEKIWICGGREDRERQSILGNQYERFLGDAAAAKTPRRLRRVRQARRP